MSARHRVRLTNKRGGLIEMVEANSKCPKCGQGTMKLIPSPDQLAPRLPEQSKLTAECDKCGHKDDVKVVAADE
jgi:C4-type Zn-finger protein